MSFENHKIAAKLPSITLFYVYAQEAIDLVPKKFKKILKEMQVKIENFADQKTLNNLKLDDKYDLLGLYRGVPLPTKTNTSKESDTIFLYRCPLIRYARENGENLRHLVHHIMYYEITHHLGYENKEALLEDEEGRPPFI